ncbi:MAG: sulfurtransferase-like selenium metabolism protein YedF [Dehalococcoidia bacterium]|nr:MAG: sulfurtransferase-like selenium metabolism protein YedF [Dehalococcoidia bacterium]
MHKEIDCRGLECPKPVVNTQQALDEIKSGTLTVIVDNQTSLENIKRLAKRSSHNIKVSNKNGDFIIDIVKQDKIGPVQKKKVEKASGDYVIFITSDRLGVGDERLGEILIKAFLNTIWDYEKKPDKIIFINNGVKLAIEDSDVLETLELLEKDGIGIISCGTCLAYYELADKLKVGLASNMYEIVDILVNTPKIVKI